MTQHFDTELTDNLPRLRAVARKMTKDWASADDLLQDTVIRMLQAQERYIPGSNLIAWAYRIMRNRHISIIRANRHDSVPLDHPSMASLGHRAPQDTRIGHNEMAAALRQLPADQRTAMLLVGGWGFGCEEVAKSQGCSLGTVKSRVSRGRLRVKTWLQDGKNEPQIGCGALESATVH